MDGRQPEYSQSDQGSAAQYSQQSQDSRSATFSSSATPTSEYGLNPSSARSGNFPDYIPRGAQQYQQSNTASANAGQMAQTNPSIAATSPTYSQHQQYSPYAPPPDMAHHPQYQGAPIYPPRGNEWPGGHYTGPPMHYGHAPGSSGPPQPSMQSPVPRPPTGGHPLSTVYSFVPIPGAQQHKRPRRRYEEIERMYKCGWQGCEKAYGTLNHLNAHVTMQSHGVKRTPEEFKEIRKEWKQKKKEEEASRKADEERARADGRNGPEHPSDNPAYGQIRQMGGPQLPPIGYAQAPGGQPGQYATQSPGMDGMPHFPQSPYTPSHPMYQQNPENPPNNYQS